MPTTRCGLPRMQTNDWNGYAVDGPFVFLQTPTGVSVVSPPGPIIDADELLHCSELVSSLHRKLRAT